MAKVPGVKRRPNGVPSALLQAHVDPDARAHVREMATAAGISMASLLEYMIRSQEVDAYGRPRCVPADVMASKDEELPLQNAS